MTEISSRYKMKKTRNNNPHRLIRKKVFDTSVPHSTCIVWCEYKKYIILIRYKETPLLYNLINNFWWLTVSNTLEASKSPSKLMCSIFYICLVSFKEYIHRSLLCSLLKPTDYKLLLCTSLGQPPTDTKYNRVTREWGPGEKHIWD